MKVRRVVTGHDDQGRAVFASDEEVEPITTALVPGTEFHNLWWGDDAPHFPDAGKPPGRSTFFPPVGGFRFGFFCIPPASQVMDADIDIQAAVTEFEEKLPGMTQYMEPDGNGMHTTPTIDFEVVLAGEVVLELDDGASAHLRPGDTVVQNGTRHAWRNPGSEPARLAVFIVGAHHGRFPAE